MYEMAKKAREAMKGKAKRLAGEKDSKVDSSNWSPAEPLDADVKTGMRPISKRAYKKGGKVEGEKMEAHAGRKPRKAGGRAITADSLINRNQKEANEEREGKKHIGGMKKGGKIKKEGGGPVDPRAMAAMSAGAPMGRGAPMAAPAGRGVPADPRMLAMLKAKLSGGRGAPAPVPPSGGMPPMKKGGKVHKKYGGGADYDTGSRTGAGAVTTTPSKPTPPMPQRRPPEPDYDEGSHTGHGTVTEDRKSGGRAKRKDGGNVKFGPMEMPAGKPGMSLAGQKKIAKHDEGLSKPKRAKASNYKAGGKAHPDEAEDKALINKMVKPSARVGKYYGGGLGGPDGMPQMAQGMPVAAPPAMGAPPMMPNMGDGKPMGLKNGGKAKGTHIAIVINGAGQKQPGADGMPPMPPGGPGAPGGVPVPMGMPPAGGAPPPPMPMPMPMPMPPGGGAGGPPMGRKAGGKVYRSYKDMDAGAGSGLGRLEKTQIQKPKA